jgi:L-methionine (R)-S-oxide reductase
VLAPDHCHINIHMPHADSSHVPSSITTRLQFWKHVYHQLEALISDQRNWVSSRPNLPRTFIVVVRLRCCLYNTPQVSNLSNAASLIYNALLTFEPHFGANERAVNCCGGCSKFVVVAILLGYPSRERYRR